ncbi:polysaccharide deacetylase family protein [Alkaliphilus sp. MSJ-5]|uniref:Polysaccharide deacetylase family protein n=1 Tax=Alkaliphilus flagellatus TaxID=2841507 RepID=A0ABS6FXI8_9FIRM|nr:polysaccharide deacetylase family protein [Alkaliphilus flagellatus]MBU5674947.1 polysaccharide deacetylase family protein [Alkaliphilus flagellatus]
MKFKILLVVICLLLINPLSALTSKSIVKDKEQEVVIPILMYHHFVEETVVETGVSEIISAELFENQLNYLKQKGFNTISISQLRDYLFHDEKLPDNPLVITIDDGYESNYTIAYPILKKNNIPANINIVVSSRGKKPGNYQHFSWEQAKDMLDSGLIEIGSHTYNLHNEDIKLKETDDTDEYYKRVYDDFQLSRKLMVQNLEKEPFIFCFPYGSYNEFSQSAALSLGFDIQLSVDYGVVTKNSDPLALERINVRGDQSPEDVYNNIMNAINAVKM